MNVLFTPRRLTVTLDENMGRALAAMSQADLRSPKRQLQWLIQQEAHRRGMLEKNEGDGPPASKPVTLEA